MIDIETFLGMFLGGDGEGGGSSLSTFSSLAKIAPFTNNLTYNDIDYEKAKAYYEELRPKLGAKFGSPKGKINIGACSVFYKNGVLARNFDLTYSNDADFKVFTPARDGLYSVQGMCMMQGLLQEKVEKGTYDKLYGIVPFAMDSGQNSAGLSVAMLIVPNDYGTTNGSSTTEKPTVTISTIMLPRYLLDHCATVDEAVDAVTRYVSVYTTLNLAEKGYELHYIIADRNRSVALEYIYGEPKIIETDKLTNFFLWDTTPNEDGSFYTPATQDAEHDAIKTNGATDYGSGFERYNIINFELPSIVDQQGFATLLELLKYSLCYDRASLPFWYTEFVGGDYKCNTSIREFDSPGGVVDKAIEEFEKRDRKTAKTWHTVHSVVYNLNTGKMYACFQEDFTKIFEFEFGYFTKQEVAAKLGNSLKIDSQQELSVEEYNNAHRNLQDGSSKEETQTYTTFVNVENVDVEFDAREHYQITGVTMEKGLSTGSKYRVTLQLGRDEIICSGEATNETTINITEGKHSLCTVESVQVNVDSGTILISFSYHDETMPNLTKCKIERETVQMTTQPFSEELIGLNRFEGYDGSKEQVFKHDSNGNMFWEDVS